MEVALESGESKTIITYNIKNVSVSFNEDDVNKAFQLLEKNLSAPTTDEELIEFLDLIHYTLDINIKMFNKKHVRRECSFMYDSMWRKLV